MSEPESEPMAATMPSSGPVPFFRTCFAPRRLTGGICLVDLVRSWAKHHSPADVEAAVAQIDRMLIGGRTDDALRIWVLGKLRCGYDPGMNGLTMSQWLTLVRDLLAGRSDWGLPEAVWEAMAPWPEPDLGPMEALRQLLAQYFPPGWRARDSRFESVVRRYVTTEGVARAGQLVNDIDELLDCAPGEERLRLLVLGRYGSGYDPAPDLDGGQTMAQWLRAVRGVAISVIVSSPRPGIARGA